LLHRTLPPDNFPTIYRTWTNLWLMLQMLSKQPTVAETAFASSSDHLIVLLAINICPMMANLVTGKGVDVGVHFGHEANRKTLARKIRVNRRRCTLLPDNGSNREQHKGFGRKDAAQNTTIKIHHPVETLRHLWEQTRQAIAFSPPPNVWLSKNFALPVFHQLKSIDRKGRDGQSTGLGCNWLWVRRRKRVERANSLSAIGRKQKQ
ncbi:MAG: hypothetical protein HZRFUVUK_000392, partial [Candidatus Fervidibacterota bacterium]